MATVVLTPKSITIITYSPACNNNEMMAARTTDFEVVICLMICLPHTSVFFCLNKGIIWLFAEMKTVRVILEECTVRHLYKKWS